MNGNASQARSDDCSSLRENVLDLVAQVLGMESLIPHIKAGSQKSTTRGFKYPVLGCLLCPVNHLRDFDADPER
jgi:hypothetical protein